MRSAKRSGNGTSSQSPATSGVRSGVCPAGTVRGTSTDDGLEVEIDLPAGAVGDEIIAANPKQPA